MSFIRKGFGTAKGTLNIQDAMCAVILGEYHQTAHITSIHASFSRDIVGGPALTSFEGACVYVLREVDATNLNTYSPLHNRVAQWMRNGAGLDSEPDLQNPLYELRFGNAVGAAGSSQELDRTWYFGEKGIILQPDIIHSVVLGMPSMNGLTPPASPSVIGVLTVYGYVEPLNSPYDKLNTIQNV